ncbi:hypothetical protein N431DRAFT_463368 [Stipitochalara longipes BDJ]|nr:hypothetical protein N431DRAFT_463368 [Stipitochalara longipes BDJ]
MFRDYVLFALLSSLVGTTSAGCNADNCLRALSNNPNSASAFCHTYTVAPAPSIPAFASPCSSSALRLSSACSCYAGVEYYNETSNYDYFELNWFENNVFEYLIVSYGCHSDCFINFYSHSYLRIYFLSVTDPVSTITITLPASTITSVVPVGVETITTIDTIATVTVGPATTCNPGGTQPTFALQVAVGWDGTGAYGVIGPTSGGDYIALKSSSATASLFTFDDVCHIMELSTEYIGNVSPTSIPDEPGDLYFNDAAQVASDPTNYEAVFGNMVAGYLQCNDPDGISQFVNCGGALEI